MSNTLYCIENILSTAAHFKNAYFWQAPQTAKERRAYEEHYKPAGNYMEGGRPHLYRRICRVLQLPEHLRKRTL